MLSEEVKEADSTLPDQQKTAVTEQLERMLKDPWFNNSKRYPKFLRYVVQHTLDGRGESLKERTLGMDVFGRSPSYDTVSDAIVRVTAGEIRKRISLYYSESTHQNEIRITLSSGSYVPHFEWPEQAAPSAVTENPSEGSQDSVKDIPLISGIQITMSPSKQSRRWTRPAALIGCACLILIGLCIIAGSRWLLRPSALEAFWHPVMSSPNPTIFCVGDQTGVSNLQMMDSSDPTKSGVYKVPPASAIMLTDALPLAQFGAFMQAHRHSYLVKGAGQTSLTDLRNGSTVLTGAYDNAWTLRLTDSLRFHFANEPDMKKLWIGDRQNPQQRLWGMDATGPARMKDYGLIARFTEPDTGNLVVLAAGIGDGGTTAAWELLLTPIYMEDLARHLPKGWENRNLEAVLETTVVNGHSGPPHVVAVYVW